MSGRWRVRRHLLRPASWLYGAGVAAWRTMHRRPAAVRHLPIPVVSVGNLTVGGTGKGPMVRWIAEALRAAGRHPVIALRGYRAGAEGSDEALEHRALLPQVPLAVGGDRALSIGAAMAADPTIDAAILDDGFQHWRLARSLDLVLIDATRPGLDEPMLPAGPRREPCSALRRADAVIVTRAERIDETLARRIEAAHGRAPIAWCRHAWTGLEVIAFDPAGGESRRLEPVPWLAARRAAVLAGLGNPAAFLDQVRRHAAGAQWLRRMPDHGKYDAPSLRGWIGEARRRGDDAIVTTLKDWVKIAPIAGAATAGGASVPFVVPRLSIEFIAGESALRERLERLDR